MTAEHPAWIAVCEAPFLPTRDGGQREHHGLVRALADRGMLAALVICSRGPLDAAPYRVAFGGPDGAGGDLPVVGVARRRSPDAHARPRTPFVWASRRPSAAVLAGLRALTAPGGPGGTPDGVLACSFKSAELATAIAAPRELPVVVRQHNVESRYHRDLGAARGGPARAYFRWEAARIARAERAMARTPGIVGQAEISGVDLAARAVGEHQRSALVPPLAVDFSVPPGPADGRSGVLFLGALDVATNQHALRWFLERVWPAVRAARPDARVTVAGRRPDAAFGAWLEGRAGVEVAYDVADPRRLMDRALVAVNPTVSGSGVNIKLLEYAAAGAAVVTTPRATAGLPPLAPGVLVEAESPAEFADGVLWALDHPGDAAALGHACATEFRARLDADRALDRLVHLMRHEESPACLPSRS